MECCAIFRAFPPNMIIFDHSQKPVISPTLPKLPTPLSFLSLLQQCPSLPENMGPTDFISLDIPHIPRLLWHKHTGSLPQALQQLPLFFLESKTKQNKTCNSLKTKRCVLSLPEMLCPPSFHWGNSYSFSGFIYNFFLTIFCKLGSVPFCFPTEP